MALPTNKAQVEGVKEFLEKAADSDPPLTLDEIASMIVDGFHHMLTVGIKKGVPEPFVGLAFKSPFFTKVSHVAWMDDYHVWVVDATSHYGWFGPIHDPLWDYIEESSAKAGAPGNNPDWQEGDIVSHMQRMYHYKVLATGDKTVLLERIGTGIRMAESSENMKKYYNRENNDRADVPDPDRNSARDLGSLFG